MLPIHLTTEQIEIFYSKVGKTPTDTGCLEWLAGCYPTGYGCFGVGNHRNRLAHRIAWELANGPIPAGLVVRHMCHNRRCVNPAHLLIGTQADNIHDMIRAGRFQNAPNTYVRPVKPTTEELFYAKVSKTPTDTGCLEWLGSRNPDGYGKFGIERKSRYAHRVAWELVNGPIPDRMVIRHFVCSNPACCNVDHLRLGTTSENMCDMDTDGHRPNTKLTDAQVLEIRSPLYRDWKLADIAQHFGITVSDVSCILRRKTWVHLDATQDAPREGGSAKGERHCRAKLTAAQVLEIRSDLYSDWRQVDIARHFGIAHGQVSAILLRKAWKHI